MCACREEVEHLYKAKGKQVKKIRADEQSDAAEAQAAKVAARRASAKSANAQGNPK